MLGRKAVSSLVVGYSAKMCHYHHHRDQSINRYKNGTNPK